MNFRIKGGDYSNVKQVKQTKLVVEEVKKPSNPLLTLDGETINTLIGVVKKLR